MTDSAATSRCHDRDAQPDGPTIVREDQMTQGTEVTNLPHSDDPIEEASEESFPASDPPAYSSRRDDRLTGVDAHG